MHGAHPTPDILRPVRPLPIQTGGGLSSFALGLTNIVERTLGYTSARFHDSNLLPRFDFFLRPGLHRSQFLPGHSDCRHQKP